MDKCQYYMGTDLIGTETTKILCSYMTNGGKVFNNKDPEGAALIQCCWHAGENCPIMAENGEPAAIQNSFDEIPPDVDDMGDIDEEEHSVEQEQQTFTTDVATSTNTQLSTERQERAIKLTRQIVANGNIAAGCMVDMGRDLKAVRDERLFTELGFDSFEEYCEKKCGIGKRHGYNFIQVYERFGEEQLSQIQGLGITKLLELAKLDDNDLGELMSGAEVSEMSVRELKDKIAEYDKTCEQLRLDLDEAESDKQEANEKNMHLKFERDEIKIQLQQAEEQRARLEQKISTLEKENQEKSKQLEASVNNACDTREKLNKQITEITALYHKEKEKLNTKIKELEERPATANEVSEEQLAAIRAEVEKSVTEKAEKEREAAVKAAREEQDKLWETNVAVARKTEKLKYAKEIEDLKEQNEALRSGADESAIKRAEKKFSEELEKLKAENAALQSNAQSTAPAPSSDDKEKIRFYLGEVQRAFNAAVEIINGMGSDEQKEFREKMKTAIERMKSALE
ncbi:MAG: hypothetical protein J6A19_04920 [Oscillospiraceae bacterium]|nr:hypothetical protein [Oscillospiraceae bacterium]